MECIEIMDKVPTLMHLNNAKLIKLNNGMFHYIVTIVERVPCSDLLSSVFVAFLAPFNA